MESLNAIGITAFVVYFLLAQSVVWLIGRDYARQRRVRRQARLVAARAAAEQADWQAWEQELGSSGQPSRPDGPAPGA